jgi:hypothetical protein
VDESKCGITENIIAYCRYASISVQQPVLNVCTNLTHEFRMKLYYQERLHCDITIIDDDDVKDDYMYNSAYSSGMCTYFAMCYPVILMFGVLIRLLMLLSC